MDIDNERLATKILIMRALGNGEGHMIYLKKV